MYASLVSHCFSASSGHKNPLTVFEPHTPQTHFSSWNHVSESREILGHSEKDKPTIQDMMFSFAHYAVQLILSSYTNVILSLC